MRPSPSPLAGEGRGEGSGPSRGGADRLRGFLERIERLERERSAVSRKIDGLPKYCVAAVELSELRRALSRDIAEVYAEAAADGFNAGIVRGLVALRSEDAARAARVEAKIDALWAAELEPSEGDPP